MIDSRKVLKNNEVISKRVNQLISQTAENLLNQGEEKNVPMTFVCECDRASCNKKLLFSILQYKRFRKKTNQFFVLKGHEDLMMEKVVKDLGNSYLVEKFD